MSDTKHTPGPWSMDEGNEVHKYGSTIYAWPKWSGIPDNEQLANMWLGMAAPELLEALEMAQLWLDYDGRYDMQKINAAIAKAKGE